MGLLRVDTAHTSLSMPDFSTPYLRIGLGPFELDQCVVLAMVNHAKQRFGFGVLEAGSFTFRYGEVCISVGAGPALWLRSPDDGADALFYRGMAYL